MHSEAHAGVGWLLGVLAPKSDRRLRARAVGAAVIPDIDAVAYLGGYEAYSKCNNRCDGCQAPVCLRQGSIAKGFRIVCPDCGP